MMHLEVICKFLVDLNGVGSDGSIFILEKGMVQCMTLLVSQLKKDIPNLILFEAELHLSNSFRHFQSELGSKSTVELASEHGNAFVKEGPGQLTMVSSEEEGGV